MSRISWVVALSRSQATRSGVVKRVAQLVGGHCRVLADLEGGQRVEAKASSLRGGSRSGADLPGPLDRVGLQLEHSQDVGEHRLHVPAGTVGRARPVLVAELIDHREQPVVLRGCKAHGLVVSKWRDGLHRDCAGDHGRLLLVLVVAGR